MSSKQRVYEVARELGLQNKALVALFQSVGVSEVRNHMSAVAPEAVERVKRHLEKQKAQKVIEERIRPTVIKRRAIKKKAPPAESAPPVASEPAAAAAPTSAAAVPVPSPTSAPAHPVPPAPVSRPAAEAPIAPVAVAEASAVQTTVAEAPVPAAPLQPA